MNRTFFRALCFCGVVLAGSAWWACYGAAAAVDLPDPIDDDLPAGSAPELPRVQAELPPADVAGRVHRVSDGDDLQQAIDDAEAGDVIALQPGLVVRGPIRLPAKAGTGWITITTDLPEDQRPKRGVRADPSNAGRMAVIESDDYVAIVSDPAAHHYRFVGIEIRPKPRVYIVNLVFLGFGAESVDELPHHIVFEHCYIHGDPHVGGRRGIALNARDAVILDSYLADFKHGEEDTQAIAGWNGMGPFLIANNYLEAAGENLLFGGGDPDIRNLVPSDIVIRDNHFAKPLSWRNEPWVVKNLFELKNARRVLVERNLMEYNWPGGQNGYAILLTPRNQDGGAPWSMVRDITFVDNVVRHVSSGINILASDDNYPSAQTKRILIRNNVFDDVSDVNWDGLGNLIQTINGIEDLTIDHNTAFATNAVIAATGGPNLRFTFTNNIVASGRYGVGGDSVYGNPAEALRVFFQDVVFMANVIQGGDAVDYPATNHFPGSLSDVGFANAAAGDYRLVAGSPYRHAGTDGKDIGAHLDAPGVPARRRAARH